MKLNTLITVIILSVFSPNTSWSETNTGTSSVIITRAITVNQTDALSFGTIQVVSAADTISIDFDGNITSENGTSSTGGAITPAAFIISGEADANFQITLSNTLLSGTGDDMPLNNLQHNAGLNPTFDTDGSAEFNVIGQIETNQNQVPGLYTGQYQVLLNYP